MNGQDLGPWVRAEHWSGMEHSRGAHIVNKRLFAKGLFKSAVARERSANAIRVIIRRKGRIAGQTELFAEIEMPTRLVAQQAATTLPGFAGCLNGVDDTAVTRAATQVTGERPGHSLAIICAT